MAGLSGHGASIWNGEQGIAQHDEATSLFTGEKLQAPVTVGCVILPDPLNSACEAAQTGLVFDIGHDPDTGEAAYSVLRVREIGGAWTARTFTVAASDVAPGCVVADASRNRHHYATGALRAACSGSRLNSNDLRLIGIAVALVKDCVT